MTTYTVSGTDNAQKTLVEGNTTTTPASDDQLNVTSTGNLNVTAANTGAVVLNLAAAPVAGGVVITVASGGAIKSADGRTIDDGGTNATGAKLTINNAGTISNANGAKQNDDAIRIKNDLTSGTFILNNTGSITTAGLVNDSVAVRLGGVYNASNISITNGSADANGNITNSTATISTADADAIRPGGVNATSYDGKGAGFGSSTVTNYGTISASLSVSSTTALAKVNGIDIGAGQASTVNNYGTIVGDESGLGADNTAGTTLFAPTYFVTNYAGATITGNNGPGIAIGSATSASAGATTSIITNFGTITGKATGVGRGGTNTTVANANGTGIYSAYAVTIVNGSASSTAAVIQATGIKGSPTVAQQGSASTYYAINALSGSVTNYGSVRETTATGAGAAINFSGSVASTVTNYGSIIGANGAAIQMGTGNDTVNLYSGGTITGSIDGGTLANDSDTLTLNAGASTTTGTISGVKNFEILKVNSGSWTLGDAETYSSGVTIASGANLTIGDAGSTGAAIVDNGTLTYAKSGNFTKNEAISGTGKLIQAGTGTLTLTNSASTYSGGTTVQSGALDITTAGAAGTGAITFSTGTQALDIEQTALAGDGSFRNTIASFGPEDTIDLRGIGSATSATFDTASNKLTVSGGNETVTLQLDAAGAPASGYAYGVSSDGAGGTNVAIDQIATVTNVTASPSSGYAKAGDTITFTLTTSKAVSITNPPPVLNLSNGGTATYDAATSTSTSLIFKSTVASGQDSTGVTITSVANAGDAQDANHVPLDFSGATGHAAVGPTIDTTAPVVAITSSAGLTNQPTQTISGTVDAATNGSPDNGTTVGIYEIVNGKNVLLATTSVDGNGAFSAPVNLSGNGNHTIFAQDTDAAGNTGTSGTVTYDLETTAPPVTITSAGGLTNMPTQTVTGHVDISTDPEAANTTVTIKDTSNNMVVGSGSLDGNGDFAIGVTLSGDGQHTLQASDTDQAGNVGFATVTYTLDTTPPAAPALALTNDTGISQTDNITSDPSVTYTASTNGETLLYSVDGSMYSSAMPAFATDGSQDGQHTVSVEEQDAAGNTSSASSLTFTLDTTAPTTAPTVSLANDTGSSPTDRITSDPSITAAVGTAGDTLLYKTDGATTYTTTAPVFRTDGTQDGAHSVVVAEEDAAGNVGPSTTLTFTLDTRAPAAPSVELANDTGSSSGDNVTRDPTITYTASNSGDTLLYKADGATAYSATVPAFAIDGTADGTRTVSVEEVDKAGNVSGPTNLTFTLDTTAPDIDFTSMGGTVNSPTQTVNGFAGADNVGTTVSIYEDGGTTAIGSALVNSDGYFSAAVNLGADGTHTLTANDTDKAGNVGTTDETLTYTVDSTAPTFTPGNLVISISGDGDGSGDYDDNEASPLVLRQITTDGTFVSQIVLPQTTTTVNGVTESVISAEYGSSSEGSLQLSADGHSLVIAGYGVNAATYNSGGAAVYGNDALAQSTSIQGGQYTAVPRVIADINANGTIDTSTVLYNVYNGNNPRSVATVDGSSFYISGQGTKGDTTQGVFYVQDGSGNATRIDRSTDTRTAVIYNGQLYISRDSKQNSGQPGQSSGGSSNISVYGPTLPTTTTQGTILQAINQSVVVTPANANTINASSVGSSVNLDPENFFFANSTTLYVADGGIPKAGGVGDGGLQKWVYNGTQWTLQYTLSTGLGIVAPGATTGTTGLIGLTGRVNGNVVELYATNQTVGDTDQKYVFGITDSLNATTNSGQSFTTLVTADPDTNIRGISFAPTPITPTIALAHDTGASATDEITNDPTLTYTKAVAGDTLLYSVNGGAYSTTAPTFTQDGTYNVSVEEKDKGGKTGPASSLTFTLDTQAPSAPDAPTLDADSDSGSSPTDKITNDATPTVTGTAEAGSTVTLYDTDGKTVLGTTTADETGDYSITASALTDGTHVLTTKATDVAGNTSSASQTTAITIDTRAPVTPAAPMLNAASDSGTAGDRITSDTTPTVTGTAEVGSTVTLYDSDGTTVLGTSTADSNGAYTITSTMLSDGAHSLTVTATDVAGNVSAASPVTTVTVDTAAPDTPSAPTLDAASDTGSSSSDGLTNDATATLTGTTEAGASLTLYDSDGKTVLGTTVADANGIYSVTSSKLSDGAHNLSVIATDAAGNASSPSQATSITIDTKAPAVPAAPILTADSDSGTSSSDGVTNDATPTLTGTAEAGSTVTLYDTDGTTVLGATTADSNGAYSVTSSPLADGSHTLEVTATDAAGNASALSSGRSVTIDTAAPATPPAPTLTAASDTGSSSTDGVTRINRPVFTGTAEAGSTVTLYEGTTVLGTGTASAMGTYSITSTALADGTHAVSATATDKAGNKSVSSSTTSITIDTVAPAIPSIPALTIASDTGASSTDGVTSVNTPTVTGTAEAGSTVTLYDSNTVIGSATADAKGNYSITSPILADGTHALKVTSTDTAGNATSSTYRTITVDTSAPATPTAPTLTAASDTGTSSTDGVTRIKTPVFTGTAEAGSTVTLYEGTTKLGTALANASGAYSVTSSALSDGTHTVSVTATDKAGNVSASSSTTSVTIDATAPAVPSIPALTTASDSGVSSTDGLTNVRTPTVTGTADAGSTVTLYDSSTVIGSVVADAKGTYTITSSALADGAHSLKVTSTDTAGNISSSTYRTIMIDTSAPATPTAPVLTAASDSGSSSTDGITRIKTPVFTGTAEAGSTVTLYEGTTKLGTAVASTSGAYSVASSALADGTHTLSVTATDKAGNVSASSSTTSVTIDATAPAVPSTPALTTASDTGASSTDGITSVKTPTVTGTAEAGSTVTLYDSNTVIGSVVADTKGTYSITSSTLADGTHSLKVTSTDVAGNVSSSTYRTITVDTKTPGRPAAPTLAAGYDTGSSSTDGVTRLKSPVLTGSAEAGASIALYDGSTVVGTATANSSGVYSVTSSALADGTHTLSVTATDKAGNTSSHSAGRVVTVDTAAPAAPSRPALTAASDSGASASDGITNVNMPTFTGTAETGSTVTLYREGSVKLGSVVVGSDGSYSITSGMALTDGRHVIYATASDAAGNVSPVSGQPIVTIDTAAPSVSINGSGGNVSSANQTIAGTGEAGTTVTLKNNGSAIGTAVTVGSNGSWSETVALSAGSNSIVATDVDKAGNAGTSQAVNYQYSPATAMHVASLHSMVQAMSTMTPTSSASITPTAGAATQEAHPLTAAHG